MIACSLLGQPKLKVSLIADGASQNPRDIVKVLTLADGVICGGLLAGYREALGQIIEIRGKYYKQYRGMGSLEAMKEFGSDSGHRSKTVHSKVHQRELEALKEVAGSVRETVELLTGGIQAGMGYAWCK